MLYLKCIYLPKLNFASETQFCPINTFSCHQITALFLYAVFILRMNTFKLNFVFLTE